jgi:NitT/TauT family transport system permease protein
VSAPQGRQESQGKDLTARVLGVRLGGLRFNPASLITLIAVLAVWAMASTLAPSQIVPSISEVGHDIVENVVQGDLRYAFLITLWRVLLGLVSAFLMGLVIGLITGAFPAVAAYALPLIRFLQGIPSVSWVVLAVIWFSDIEIRVWFIMVMVTLPGFALQIHDSYRAIPEELRDMARSFRPGRRALMSELIIPGVMPGIFTTWKVNLGLGIRVVLIAELVGATVGVGVQLLSAQQLFDMAAVVAWTLMLAITSLVVQGAMEVLENWVLRYRPAPARKASRAVAGDLA